MFYGNLLPDFAPSTGTEENVGWFQVPERYLNLSLLYDVLPDMALQPLFHIFYVAFIFL